MAFKRRRRGFRKKKPTQWVAGSGSSYGGPPLGPGAGLGIDATGFFSTPLLGAAASDSTDPPVLNRFTIERVLGDIFIVLQGVTQNTLVSIGIKVEDQIPGGLFPVCDPSDPAAASESWMYLRNMYMPATGPNPVRFELATSLQNMRVAVDIKSRRVITNDKVLGLHVAVRNAAGGALLSNTDGVFVYNYLRTLISRVA